MPPPASKGTLSRFSYLKHGKECFKHGTSIHTNLDYMFELFTAELEFGWIDIRKHTINNPISDMKALNLADLSKFKQKVHVCAANTLQASEIRLSLSLSLKSHNQAKVNIESYQTGKSWLCPQTFGQKKKDTTGPVQGNNGPLVWPTKHQ